MSRFEWWYFCPSTTTGFKWDLGWDLGFGMGFGIGMGLWQMGWDDGIWDGIWDGMGVGILPFPLIWVTSIIKLM